MSTATPTERLSVDAYLARELSAAVKSEYVGGVVYAMVGGTNRHNQIATNVLGMLHARLRGHRCRAFNSDTKIRIQLPDEIRFYYPDASVICQPNSVNDSYQDRPAVVVEVLSPSTRRIDEGEKKDHTSAYRGSSHMCWWNRTFRTLWCFNAAANGSSGTSFR